jgi:hypothetical protein
MRRVIAHHTVKASQETVNEKLARRAAGHCRDVQRLPVGVGRASQSALSALDLAELVDAP